MHNNLILLPHEPTIEIQDLAQKIHYLNIMNRLLEHFLLAINDYLNQKLSQFDAQVGDTLCQIRAYKIHYLATLDAEGTCHELIQLKTVMQKALSNSLKYQQECEQYLTTPKNQRPDWVRSSITLKDLFAEIDALIPLSDNALFLVLSHLLCHFHQVDEEQIPMSIDVRRIASQWSLSQGYAKKLAHYFQKMLADASCTFIFELLSELPKLKQLHTLLPLLHRKGDEGRMVLPCYAVTEIIVHHMIQSEARAVMIMKTHTQDAHRTMRFHFQGNPNLNEFIMLTSEERQDDTPCMVFYGTAAHHQLPNEQLICAKIQTIGLSHIILTNNAAHPQFSGSALLAFRINPYTALLQEPNQYSDEEHILAHQLSDKLNNLQDKAHSMGFTQDNSSLFFLKHIYCSTTDVYPLGKKQERPNASVTLLRHNNPTSLAAKILRSAY